MIIVFNQLSLVYVHNNLRLADKLTSTKYVETAVDWSDDSESDSDCWTWPTLQTLDLMTWIFVMFLMFFMFLWRGKKHVFYVFFISNLMFLSSMVKTMCNTAPPFQGQHLSRWFYMPLSSLFKTASNAGVYEYLVDHCYNALAWSPRTTVLVYRTRAAATTTTLRIAQ